MRALKSAIILSLAVASFFSLGGGFVLILILPVSLSNISSPSISVSAGVSFSHTAFLATGSTTSPPRVTPVSDRVPRRFSSALEHLVHASLLDRRALRVRYPFLSSDMDRHDASKDPNTKAFVWDELPLISSPINSRASGQVPNSFSS